MIIVVRGCNSCLVYPPPPFPGVPGRVRDVPGGRARDVPGGVSWTLPGERRAAIRAQEPSTLQERQYAQWAVDRQGTGGRKQKADSRQRTADSRE